MAKWNRTVVGSVMTGKDGSTYIKIRDNIAFTKGQTLNLESKKMQLQSAEAAIASGKLNGEVAEKVIERINKIPDFVKFEIVKLEKQ